MSRSLPDRFDATPRKISALPGEGCGNKVPDLARLVGEAIGRALELARIERKVAAFRMGYASENHLSQWIAGVENPQLAKLLSLDGFRSAFILALAEEDGGVEIRVTLPARKAVNA